MIELTIMNLTTGYLGLTLRNPFVIGASPLGDTLESALRLEAAGAGAIVLRSLFPEQMPSSSESEINERGGRNDAANFPSYADYQLSPEAYLSHVQTLKQRLSIPVIASLNGHRPSGWTDYARRLEVAGADAIELNFYQVITDPGLPADRVEMDMLKTTREVAEAVRIPIAAKLSPFHASIGQLAVALELAGAAGIVVFNRFYQPDVNTADLRVQPRLELSNSSELLLRLRWLAILSPHVRGTLAAGGGVHTADDVIKALLTGAHAVQLVSVIMRQGPPALASLREGVTTWMQQHDFNSIADFRGKLNLEAYGDPGAFERANYIRILQTGSG